jgi:hypothetical protein
LVFSHVQNQETAKQEAIDDRHDHNNKKTIPSKAKNTLKTEARAITENKAQNGKNQHA